MVAVRAETFHPLAGFSDDTPTTRPDSRSAPQTLVEGLPPRDHATLTFVEGPLAGAIIPMAPGSSLLLGRGASANVRIPEDTVSREHARIRWDGSGYVIEDRGSTGTWVNGWRVDSWRPLPACARVQLGAKVRLRFDLHDEAEQRVLAELYEAAMRDALTGAYTRRYLRERLHAELSYASRHKTPVALLMIDLDHFKRVNDRHGHQAGDAVLRVVVAELRAMLRPEDVLVRYGGEELCVLARGLDVESAKALAERLRSGVAGLRIPVVGADLRITVSVGIAVTDGTNDPPTVSALVERADRALYRAKRAGRNRAVVGP
ncbi:MAG TPA: GGDEF domain-containing protein [Sandaracinaceae bacterium]